MTDNDTSSGADQSEGEVTVETTSVFRSDFLNELDAPPATSGEGAVSGVEGLPAGSALLVVKRGPNAGSRFLLDQARTSAGRHPDSDIFLDDVTVSRRHAEFRLESGEFQVVDVGSLNDGCKRSHAANRGRTARDCAKSASRAVLERRFGRSR